ncbi:endonuclease/exonuclease/phosphatase family protein [Tepidibacter formicigenes]|nr:endonuclease/exonuclease/phosphatase family protein [Tepidibacter formicigenes]
MFFISHYRKKHIFLPSKIEQRGLIHTIIQIKDKKLSVLNTHLGLSSKERAKQFNVINEYIESIEQPYILAGDLNTTNPKLNSNYLIDTGKEMNKENLSTFMLLNKRIDYIFTSKELEVLKYDVYPVYMSDHYPVFVQLKL